MNDMAVVGTCPICGQGRLLVVVDNATNVMFVSCEECESEWDTPHSSHHGALATRDTHGTYTVMTRDELANHPWSSMLW
jgi:hypothetical protein